jgi:uncharacterized protein YndB with AHSA1/START domain
MSVYLLQFTTLIEGPPETIFDLIADMPNYRRWLPGSDAFGGTTEVSPCPVRLGTTYLDAGPLGQRPGSVTGYDPPKHIAFHQTMLLKQGPLTAHIDVHINMTFEPVEGATHVVRALDLAIQIPGLLTSDQLGIWQDLFQLPKDGMNVPCRRNRRVQWTCESSQRRKQL